MMMPVMFMTISGRIKVDLIILDSSMILRVMVQVVLMVSISQVQVPTV